MARFIHSKQKYDQNGILIPKGRDGLKNYRQQNPDVLIFDSKSEYEVYKKLLIEQEEGLIQNLEVQIRFNLVSGRKWWNNIKKRWDVIRPLDYIADFVFIRDGQKIVLDCKNWRQKTDKKTGKVKWDCYYDDIYKIKRKLLLERYEGQFVFEEI